MKAIYILRDPRDNYASYLKKRRADSLTLYPEEFVYYWGQSMFSWMQYASKYPQRCLLLRYEDLAAEPEKQMRRVVDFLEISWDDILLQPTRNGIFWSGNSMHGSVFSGLSPTSIGRYKTSLDLAEVQTLEFWLAPSFPKYGWARESNRVPFSIPLRSLLGMGGTKIILRLKMLPLVAKLRMC